MEQLVTIELFNRTYTFKTSSEGIQAQEVADFLAREVAKIQSQQIGSVTEMNKLTIMILVALNIASVHFESKANQAELVGNVAMRSQHILRLLEDGMACWDRSVGNP